MLQNNGLPKMTIKILYPRNYAILYLFQVMIVLLFRALNLERNVSYQFLMSSVVETIKAILNVIYFYLN